MKLCNYFKIFLFVFLVLSIIQAKAENSGLISSSLFKMPESSQYKLFPIEKTITEREEIDISSIQELVYSMSVNMDLNITCEDFLVRLILEDANNNIYLMAEFNPMNTNSNKISCVQFCEETSIMWKVRPKQLRIYIYGAELILYSLCYTENANCRNESDACKKADSLRENQALEKCSIINNYLLNNQQLWIPGVTSLSKMKFSDRMRIIGGSESSVTDGIEYYTYGIFYFKSHDVSNKRNIKNLASNTTSNCVQEFSWRDRHGKNWLTPVKDQGQSGFCSAFAAVSCVEAIANLYYNQILNLDLSEQEAAVCNEKNNPWIGMDPIYPLEYIRLHGICEETAYPFVDDSLESTYCRSSEIFPEENIRISSTKSIHFVEDSIKKALIKYGPLVSGYRVFDQNTHFRKVHAMALYGFSVVHEGDTVAHLVDYSTNSYGLYPPFIIENGSPLIGKTVWKFKNSYINGDDSNPPYLFIVFENVAHMYNIIAVKTPIYSLHYNQNDIVCSDEDGDGYYFWGIGEKPSTCPSWVPDESDGDDSNPHVGPMDEYGFTSNVNPENNSITYISTSTNTSSPASYSNNVVVQNNATWTISHELHFHYGAWIRVKSGATLKIDGGALISANVILESGSNLIIENNGLLVSPSTAKFHAGVGVNVNVVYGQIY